RTNSDAWRNGLPCCGTRCRPGSAGPKPRRPGLPSWKAGLPRRSYPKTGRPDAGRPGREGRGSGSPQLSHDGTIGLRRFFMIDPLYPAEATCEEEVAGFKVTDILAPHAFQGDGLRTIKAVVYSCGPSHRVIKMRHPNGRIFYKLQQFGMFADSPDYEEADWLPVGLDLEFDPNKAVGEAGRIMRAAPD